MSQERPAMLEHVTRSVDTDIYLAAAQKLGL